MGIPVSAEHCHLRGGHVLAGITKDGMMEEWYGFLIQVP